MRIVLALILFLAPSLAAAQEMTTNRDRPTCLGQNGELTAAINGPHQKRHRKAVEEVIRLSQSEDLRIYGAPQAAFKIEFYTQEWKIKPISGSACEVQWLRTGEAGDWAAFTFVNTALGDGAVRSCLTRALEHAVCKGDGKPPRVVY